MRIRRLLLNIILEYLFSTSLKGNLNYLIHYNYGGKLIRA